MQKQVVLLHGLARTKLSMLTLKRRLSASGYTVHNYGYRSLTFPIEQQAARLAQFLKEHTNPELPLNFVTHSLGSIIVRKFALSYHSDFKLRRIVMLGPPNQGSSFARKVNKIPGSRIILGPAFAELCNLRLEPASDKIEVGIIAGGKKGVGYSPLISGDNDGIVSVEETHLTGARDLIIVPGLHSLLMYYRQSWDQILSFLETGRFKH